MGSVYAEPMMRRGLGAALLLGLALVGCSSGEGGSSGGGALGICNGKGRSGGSTSCTVNLICARGKYELECKPGDAGTTVDTCTCIEADVPGKTVPFDPQF